MIESFDVIVIGTGPGGCAAAKRCGEQGLRVLLLEKHSLPREKVCSGMLGNTLAGKIIRNEFGEIPDDIIAAKHEGLIFTLPGAETVKLQWPMPLFWRKDFDFWLFSIAKKVCTQTLDNSEVRDLGEDIEGCFVTLEDGRTIRSRFIIGADGGPSVTRTKVFSDFHPVYKISMRECYQTNIDINKDWYHWFFRKGEFLPYFNLHYKGESLLLQMPLTAGVKIDQRKEEARKYMAENFGFDLSVAPKWCDGCRWITATNDLVNGLFIPVKGNILLVGDAAGFGPPLGEGIMPALESGFKAAEAVAESLQSGQSVAVTYMNKLYPLIQVHRELLHLLETAARVSSSDPAALPRVFSDFWKKMLEV